MPEARRIVLLLAIASTFAACKSSCAGKTASGTDAGAREPPPPPIAPEDFPPAPGAWTFQVVRRATEFALPAGCTTRAPTVAARVGSPVQFAAEPRSLGQLLVREASGMPTRLTAAGVITLNPDGASQEAVRLPWMHAGSTPRVARTKTGGFVAGIDRAVLPAHVSLWRGGTTEDLGEGDEFETIDMACGDERCALLTSRRATVAIPGVEVWFGKPADAASAWRSVEIEAPSPCTLSPERCHGVGIAGVDSGHGVVVVTTEMDDVVFFAVEDQGAPHEIARLPAPHGSLDAIAQPAPMSLVYASAFDDEDGCAHEGGKLELVRAGSPSIPFHAPAPPEIGSIRRLAKGYFASWLAPLGCHEKRHVVYAVVLDEAGKPISDVMPVGDVSTTTNAAIPNYAVAASGSDVDLWLEAEGSVTWLRARCEPK